MPKYRLSEGEDFEYLNDSLKSKLERCFGVNDSSNLLGVVKSVCDKTGFGGFYLPKQKKVEIENDLPIRVSSWPLCCRMDPIGYEVAEIKLL